MAGALMVLAGSGVALAQDVRPAVVVPVVPDLTAEPGPASPPALTRVVPATVPSAPSITAFSLFDGTYIHNIFPGRETKATAYQETAGLSIVLNPTITIGMGGTFNATEQRLLYLQDGRSSSSGPGGFINASLNLPDGIVFGGAFGFAGLETRLFRTVQGLSSVGEYHTRNLFGSAFISKFIPLNDMVFVTPQARVTFSNSRSDAFAETTGIFNPEKTSVLGRASVGGQIGLAIPAANWLIVPNTEVFFSYDFRRPAFQSDRTGVEIRPGVFAVNGNLSLGASYQRTLERSDYASFQGFRAFLTYKLDPGAASIVGPREAVHSWTGGYVGGNAGYATTGNACGGFAGGSGCLAGNLSVPTFPTTAATDVAALGGSTAGIFNNRRTRDGFVGGAQAGYNYQLSPGGGVVLGVEADLQYADLGNKGTTAIPAVFGSGAFFQANPVFPAVSIFPGAQGFGIAPGTGANGIGNANVAVFRNGVGGGGDGRDWFGTVRGRVGYGFDRLLVFGTGGVAFTQPRSGRNTGFAQGSAVPVEFFVGPASVANAATVVPTGGAAQRGDGSIGYAVGGGLEYAVTDNVSAKLDGLYMDFDAGRRREAGTRIVGVSNVGAPITVTGSVATKDDLFLVRTGFNVKFESF